MAVLEVIVWLLLGAALALGRLVLAPPGPARWPPGWPYLLALGAVAAFVGGLLGWFLVPASLGEQNIASIMLAATTAAVALLVREAIIDRRSWRAR